MKNKIYIALLLVIASFLFAIIFPKSVAKINGTIENSFYAINGESDVDSNIVLITITDKDILSLGGWPLKRSYYALLLNRLSKLNVKRIGFEIFLAPNSSSQRIYNSLLFSEIRKNNNLYLSAFAKELKQSQSLYKTSSFLFPEFTDSLGFARIGHINFIENNGIVIPKQIHFNGNSIHSLSDLISGKIAEHKIKINFHSSISKFKHYSLLEFFDEFDSGKNLNPIFKNKIILIGVTDPTIGKSIKTSFDEKLPGLGIHAFALDNIELGRWLNDNFYNFSTYFFLLLIVLVILKVRNRQLPVFGILFFALFVIVFILFVKENIQLNYFMFILPILFLSIVELVNLFIEKETELSSVFSEKEVLVKTLKIKEEKLRKLHTELEKSTVPNELLKEKIKRLTEEVEKIKASNIDDETVHTAKHNADSKNFMGIIYSSELMENIIGTVKKVAPSDATVLITGESGSGKELIAQAIHKISERNKNEMIAFNCAAISESLLESELFGHVKGAFTDATKDKIGKFEAADNSTIFLDEIGETSERFQAKLLRVIQSGEFQKVGSSVTEKVNVRVIAATNRNLEDLVSQKKFREDLYYRLNVITITLPPLNKRREDIPHLASYFASKEKPGFAVAKSVMKILKETEWKGNIRELESTIKRASIFASSEGREIIQLKDLPKEMIKKEIMDFKTLVLTSLREKSFSHSSISETAKELGDINRTIVAENFRGIFFETFFENEFDFEKTVKAIANTDDEEVLKRITKKGETYLSNIQKDLNKSNAQTLEITKKKFVSKYKNLPNKYHYFLDRLIEHLLAQNT